jgi:hypothetical protein
MIHEEPDFPCKSWRDDPVSFLEGKYIDPSRIMLPMPLVYETNHVDGMEAEPYIEGKYPVVSDFFIKTLTNAGVDNFQLFPAILKSSKTMREWTDYHAFNVIGLIDAALMEECSYDVIMEGSGAIPPVVGFHHYVFSAEKLKDEPRMFRLWHSRDLFFSDHVMQVLKNIMPLDKWNISATKVPVK